MMTVAAENTEAYLGAFEASLGDTKQEWLKEFRSEGMAGFRRLGFPTNRHEEWRYTRLKGVVEGDYHRIAEAADLPADLGRYGFGGLDATHVVLVNGRLQAPADLPAGLRVEQLDAMAQGPGWANTDPSDGFAALNQAFAGAGVAITVDNNVALDKPLHVISVAHSDDAIHPRLLLNLGAGAEAVVLETFAGTGSYLNNAVADMRLGDNAKLQHVRLQDDSAESNHIGSVNVVLGRDCVMNSHYIALGGALSRLAMRAVFDGSGSELDLQGLLVGHGKQLHDLFSHFDHKATHCSSNELIKSVLKDKSTGIFNGKVQVRPGAIKSAAVQYNKNLLLDTNAVAHTRPQLEIDNDDVTAAHGATVGQLDDNMVFYMRSRGIPEVEVRRQLTRAFALEVIESTPSEAIHDRLNDLLMASLAEGGA